VPVPSREAEIELIAGTARQYFDLPVEDLEQLFEESLDRADASGRPHRGGKDRSSWWQTLARLEQELAKQEPAATATAVFAASQAVDWAHQVIGLDLTDYNVPIAILVALAVKAFWTQLRSDGSSDDDDDDDQQHG
jgi:hypothetical protein